MNNKKTGIIALCFIVLMIIAVGAYSYLSEGYGAEREREEIRAREAESKNKSESEFEKAADFTVYNTDGYKVNLSDFKGKPVIVNFWATWCGPCKSELPAFENVYKKYGDKIQFMMVNMTDGQRETIQVVNDFVSENGYTFPLYYDLDMSAAVEYNVVSIPTTLFIDADGNIVKERKGTVSEGYITENAEMITK